MKRSNHHQLYYQPKNIWVGDVMPYASNGKFYIYHQRDTRNPGPFGEPFGWALATTEDFVHYQDFGESLLRGADDERDQFIYAGSVFEADGKVHAFYTGYNREFLKEGKTSQVLLHAESDDFVHWKKSEQALQLEPQPGYDIRNWRDPFIVWDDENEEYLLILGARKGQDKHLQTGRLVKFTSKDLKDWDFKGDFWAPNLYTMFEMPELFKIGDWWYLVYSEYSDKNKILYRMSKSLNGPWIKPKDDAFDGRAYYAGRTAFDGKRRVLFGWVPTKKDDEDLNNYLWGGTLVPHEVYQREDFSLGVKPVAQVWEAFQSGIEKAKTQIRTVDTREEKVLIENTGEIFKFETTLTFTEGTSDFSIRLYKNEETDESYEFRFNLDDSILSFDKNPCYPWFQYMNKGLTRPLNLKPGKEYNLKVIVDDSILTLYIDGLALNARVYHKFGQSLAMTATNGTLDLDKIRFSNKLN
ncbi:family 43 glycosylhydrolase [Oceanobacillus sojae]|uniref:family 43 glycosylhydrolase n=1 Tax=Oceanobacillus sojae TaxID=582851 RepID=UPI0021A54560|nr:family 43 glycosylhydrolase [Oceanobacillus sojae]MCT1905227.1 family 43 glycosylhydrolase [Oceanobacillus sojae]